MNKLFIQIEDVYYTYYRQRSIAATRKEYINICNEKKAIVDIPSFYR
jgi:hypothetical protein